MALAVVLLVRATLPEVLRRVIVSQASQALNARVDIGDVDLRLWRGGVTLEDVAVREKNAPEAPPAPENMPEDAAPPPPAFDAYSPIVGFHRLAVELRYLPLFSKIVQFRDIELDQPRVALDRLADGEINILALVPKQKIDVEAGATPVVPTTPTIPEVSAAPEVETSQWAFGLDKFLLNGGRVRFRDLALSDSEPVEIGIDRISVDQIALTPSVYGKPGILALKLGVDEGTIDLTAHLTLDGSKVSVSTDIAAQSLPVRRARLYVPNVGWSDLGGLLDLDLTYDLVPEQTNALHGTLALRDVSVAVPDLTDVAVGWKNLSIALDRIDLITQRADIQDITLDGASVAVRVVGGDLLPALAPKAATATPSAETPAATPTAPEATASAGTEQVTSPSVDSSPTPTAESETATATAVATATMIETSTAVATAVDGSPTPTIEADSNPHAAEPSPPAEPTPWTWKVANVHVTDSRVRVLSELPPLDVGVHLDATSVTGDADAVGHIALALALDSGSMGIDGDFRITPSPAFGGTLKITDLPLPLVPVLRRALPREVLIAGNLSSDLVIAAGLPATAEGHAVPDRLAVSGKLGLTKLKLAPPNMPGLSVEVPDLDLKLDRLSLPGVIPVGHEAARNAAIDLVGTLTLRDPHLVRTGEQPLDFAAQSLALTLPSLAAPAVLAKLGPGDPLAIVTGDLVLELEAPRVATGDAITFEADHLGLRVTKASLPVMAGTAVTASAPATLDLQLDLAAPKIVTAQGKEIDARAETIALQLTDIVVPGFIAGAPLAPSADAMQAKAMLTLTQPAVMRGDGKEFSVSAKSIVVPMQSLLLPGGPGGIPPGIAVAPLQASFGEIRLEAPAIRITRTKDGIVLPASVAIAAPSEAAPEAMPAGPSASSPSASRVPFALQIAALRVVGGSFDLTDRAVKPTSAIRWMPIEIDARNIALPGPKVRPLKIDITNLPQGHISVRGNLDPDGKLEVKVDQVELAPFNSYATTYSPYGIADGVLTLEVKGEIKGGRFEVTNDIRLHQLDLSGSEADSQFEKSFGVPLDLALALLRDLQGNIDLKVPLQIDPQGNAKIDIGSVVRSALQQALAGAITSPLKMLGSVAGGDRAPSAPQPIAFRLGRAEPTDAGAESATRLAGFLASRPGMAVELSSAATPADVRWLHEQALLPSWAEEGFFERSLALVIERGPRERIRAYLEARIEHDEPKLSAEDKATLDEWLQEIPQPSPQALADARLAAVERVLHEKGIEPARISRAAAPAEATKPIVGIHLHAAKPPPGAEE